MEFSVKNLAMLRADSHQLDTDLLVYLLRSPTVRDQIAERQAQTCQQFLALRDIRDLKVPLPPSPSNATSSLTWTALRPKWTRRKNSRPKPPPNSTPSCLPFWIRHFEVNCRRLMARKTSSGPNPAPSTLTSQQGLELLRRQLERMDSLSKLRYDDPEVKKWEVTTENILHGAFGKPDGYAHDNTREFDQAQPLEAFHLGIPDVRLQQSYLESLRTRRALLESLC